MKKYFIILVCCFFVIPFMKVRAIECIGDTINVSDYSFTCSKIEGDKLTFKDSEGNDYSKFFTYDDIEKKKTTVYIDEKTKFGENDSVGVILISDGVDETYIKINNPAYVTTTKEVETTTTKDPNIKEITITLDPNNGSEKVTKTCDIAVGSSNCTITLPKLDTTGFNGWGTAKSCKEGSSGSIRVEENKTYYACYTTNTNTDTEENSVLYLKTLEISNKDTSEKIDFGTFSIKKTNYEFKVLNDVENLEIKTTQDDNIKVEITGAEGLKEGENEISIKLTSDNGEENEYVLKVTRLKEGETLESVHYLKSLVVGGYEIGFNKDKFIYNLTIASDLDNLLITPVVLDSKDTFEIVGNENLANGSVIQIKVKGEDDNVTIYTINITKEKKVNLILYIAIGVILLLVILLVILIIIKSNKKKKNQNNVGPETLDNKKDVEVLNI